MCVRACVGACACVRARACARVCVCMRECNITRNSILDVVYIFTHVLFTQIAPYLAEYFPVTFRAVQPYVSCDFCSSCLNFDDVLQLRYISSAASLYFPYDFCLYSGMTALASYTFRYIPFVLTIIISTILYTANRYVLL